jgi:hypothetical protein
MRTALTGRTHGCTDQATRRDILLANPEPSTHGTTRTFRDVRATSVIEGNPDVQPTATKGRE